VPRIPAIACFFAFSWNVVLAGMGGLLFCAHDAGGAHWVAQTEHTEESHGLCCHHDGQVGVDVAMEGSNCASCEDTLLSGSFLEFSAPGFERSSLKTPVALASSPGNLRLFVSTILSLSAETPTGAPPILEDARCEFSDTIRILC